MQIRQNLVSSSKYHIKCPNSMKPEYVTFHNTDNGNAASADAEVRYMISNDREVSFHVAVDDTEAVQGIPFNRNAWHCGDGNGSGNRKSVGVEICKNTLGANNSIFKKAEENAAQVCAQLLKQFNLPISRLKPHKHWSGKNCPSTTNHAAFIKRVESILNGTPTTTTQGELKNGDYTGREAIVTASTLNVRYKRWIDGLAEPKILATLPKGTKVRLNYSLKGWVSIEGYKGEHGLGYVNSKYLKMI